MIAQRPYYTNATVALFRKMALEELRRLRVRYQQLLEQMAPGYTITTKTGKQITPRLATHMKPVYSAGLELVNKIINEKQGS